jgi:hypothetical protein
MVYAEDVKAILRPVLAHRLMLTPDAILQGETVDNVLERVIGRVRPPLGVKNEVVPTSSKRSAPSLADGSGDELEPADSSATGRSRRGRARATTR